MRKMVSSSVTAAISICRIETVFFTVSAAQTMHVRTFIDKGGDGDRGTVLRRAGGDAEPGQHFRAQCPVGVVDFGLARSAGGWLDRSRLRHT